MTDALDLARKQVEDAQHSLDNFINCHKEVFVGYGRLRQYLDDAISREARALAHAAGIKYKKDGNGRQVRF